MSQELQDVLQHYGVKGMKWGKVKSGAKAKADGVKKTVKKKTDAVKKTAKKKTDAVKKTAKTHVDSIKRENSWKKQLNNASNMSTKQLQKVANRAQLENDLKRLSKKSGVGGSKDKKDYLKRGKMDDQELFRKVQRLRAKDSLLRNANDATKAQRELATKIVKVAAPLVISYALTGRVSSKDVMNAVMNPGGAKAKVTKELMEKISKSQTKHSDDLEDILLHYGVKGMKWGVVRSKIQKTVKARRAKQNKKVLERHEKLKNNKTYKKLHAQNSKRYKTELGAARQSQRQLAEIRRNKTALALAVATKATILSAPLILKGMDSVADAARNPDNIRRAKNVVQAMKRSPIRYVDGKKMKNVINFD